jgi:hypothetical protein
MWYTTEIGTEISIGAIVLFNKDARQVVLNSGDVIDLSEKEYNELHAKVFPPKKVADKGEPAYELLQKLHALTGGKNAAVLTPQRSKKLLALIDIMRGTGKDKLTPAEAVAKIVKAAENIGKDKFLQGENDNHKRYGDVDYLLRPDKAAKYAEINPEDKRKNMF